MTWDAGGRAQGSGSSGFIDDKVLRLPNPGEQGTAVTGTHGSRFAHIDSSSPRERKQ